MSSEEARTIVQSGLDRRNAAREQARNEARLENYERDMIRVSNARCADGRAHRALEQRLQAQDREIQKEHFQRKAARMDAKAKAEEREHKTAQAFKLYTFICCFFFWLTTWTYLPVYAAVALSVSGVSILLAYLYRLYNPVEGAKEAARE